MEKCHDNKNQHWNVTESYNFKSIADGTFSYTVNTKCDHAKKNDERADYNLTFCCWNSSEPEEMAQWNAHNQCEPNGNVDQLRRKLSTYDKLREKFYSLYTIIHSRRKIYMRILNENALTFEKCFQKGMELNWISSEFHYYIISNIIFLEWRLSRLHLALERDQTTSMWYGMWNLYDNSSLSVAYSLTSQSSEMFHVEENWNSANKLFDKYQSHQW